MSGFPHQNVTHDASVSVSMNADSANDADCVRIATEVVRAALAQAWDEGLRHGCANNGNYENNNPYTDFGRLMSDLTTEHCMIAGSHESPRGAECRCGAAWDRWIDQCVKVLQDQELTKSDFDALETTDDVAEALWEQAHKTPATKSFKRTKR